MRGPGAYVGVVLLTSPLKGLMIHRLIVLQDFEEFEYVGREDKGLS